MYYSINLDSLKLALLGGRSTCISPQDISTIQIRLLVLFITAKFFTGRIFTARRQFIHQVQPVFCARFVSATSNKDRMKDGPL